MLLVYDLDGIFVLSLEEEWSELDLSRAERNIRLIDFSHNQEVLHNVL